MLFLLYFNWLKQSQEYPGGPVAKKDCAFTAEDVGSVLSQGTKISQAVWCGQKIKKKRKKNYLKQS